MVEARMSIWIQTFSPEKHPQLLHGRVLGKGGIRRSAPSAWCKKGGSRYSLNNARPLVFWWRERRAQDTRRWISLLAIFVPYMIGIMTKISNSRTI